MAALEDDSNGKWWCAIKEEGNFFVWCFLLPNIENEKKKKYISCHESWMNPDAYTLSIAVVVVVRFFIAD